jgi:hypothetical protein
MGNTSATSEEFDLKPKRTPEQQEEDAERK